MKAKLGDTVRVHYTGKLRDGQVFETSETGQPLEITIGSGRVISGFEKNVIGMKPGDSKSFAVPPKEAFGPRREDLLVEVQKSELPEDIDPYVGKRLYMGNKEGRPVGVIVADISDEAITIDANHPLAGKTLVFDVQLVDIA